MPQSACSRGDVSPSLGNSHVKAYGKSNFKVPCCRKEYEKNARNMKKEGEVYTGERLTIMTFCRERG